MLVNVVRLFCLIALSSLSVIGTAAQGLPRSRLAELLRSVEDDQRHLAECQKLAREEQIAKFEKPLPLISGHCYSGECPVSLPKPWYPNVARQNKINGQVVVDALVDEQGKVAYARFVSGPAVFREPAITAAYRAVHQRKQACGRPIKFWWRIKYNFAY